MEQMLISKGDWPCGAWRSYVDARRSAIHAKIKKARQSFDRGLNPIQEELEETEALYRFSFRSSSLL
jgi:hypothetical protein